MARRRKKSSHRCKYGRSPYTGRCYASSSRGGRGKRRGKRRAGKQTQAKPTPLFADIVRYARAGTRYPCESPQRNDYIGKAWATLNAHAKNIDSLSTPTSKPQREAAIRRALKQIKQASGRNCGSVKKRRIDQWVGQQLNAAGLPVPNYVRA